MIASYQNKIETVKKLTAADVNAVTKEGWTALMIVSRYGKNQTEALNALTERAAFVNFKNKNGWTALMLAVYADNMKTAVSLIENGADVNSAKNNGATALMIAADGGNIDMVKFLLSKGANIDIAGYYGTALNLAVLKDNTDMMKFLVRSGADVNKSGKNGKTPLMNAVMKGNIDIAKYLINNGADVNARERKTGYTPLDYAAENEVMVNFLKQNGASKANAKDYGAIISEKFTATTMQSIEDALGSCASLENIAATWMVQWTPKGINNFLEHKVRILENTKGVIEFLSREEGEKWLNGVYNKNKMNSSVYGRPSEAGLIVPVM
jgi:ankyrin repeat protein